MTATPVPPQAEEVPPECWCLDALPWQYRLTTPGCPEHDPEALAPLVGAGTRQTRR